MRWEEMRRGEMGEWLGVSKASGGESWGLLDPAGDGRLDDGEDSGERSGLLLERGLGERVGISNWYMDYRNVAGIDTVSMPRG